MKKSISISSLLAIFLIAESCERTDDFQDKSISTIPTTRIGEKSGENISKDSKPGDFNQAETNSLEPGDDEEPRKDKQHWRINSDSLKSDDHNK